MIVALSYDTNEGCYGTVRWYGQVKSTEYPTESTTSLPFLYGVHLDEKRGNSDGSLRGRNKRPFKCPPGFGVFVPPNHIKELSPDKDPNNKLNHRPNKLQHLSNIQEVDGDGNDVTNITIHRGGGGGDNHESKDIDLDEPQLLQQRSSINKGLLITRGQDPNHLHQGNLFFFLRKLGFRGIVNYTKIGIVDNTDKIEKIKTKSMLNVIYPQTNQYIYNYLPLLSKTSEYDAIFNPERNSQIDIKSKNKHKSKSDKSLLDGIDDDIKEKEQDNNLPIVNIWYLNLHESWFKHSNKIKALGVSDYQSSQWVTQSQKRAVYWYTLLNYDEKRAKSIAKTRFDAAPLPLFLKHKQEERDQKMDDMDDMKINYHNSAKQTLYSSICSHYIPLGIFHNKRDHTMKNEVEWLEGPPIPHLIDKLNFKIEFRLKRLIHEPVANMKEILPYLHSKQYRLDKNDNKYGWFPIDWVYAEIDISDDDIEHKWSMAHLNYTGPFEDGDEQQINVGDQNSFNPYWFMKYPRIPLFILSVKLPLKNLQQYAVQCVNEKYGSHSPQMVNIQPSNQRKHKKQRLQVHQPPINTSISIDNHEFDAIGNPKRNKNRDRHRSPKQKRNKERDRDRDRERDRDKKHKKYKPKHRHYNDEDEYNSHRHKYQIPKPKAKHRDVRYHRHDRHQHSPLRHAVYDNDEDLTETMENQLTEVANQVEMDDEIEMQKFKRNNKHRTRHSKHDKHGKYNKRRGKDKVSSSSHQRYQYVNQSDDEEDDDANYIHEEEHHLSRSENDDEESLSAEEDSEDEEDSDGIEETGSESEDEYEDDSLEQDDDDDDEEDTGDENESDYEEDSNDDDEETESTEEESESETEAQGAVTYKRKQNVSSNKQRRDKNKKDRYPLAPNHASPSYPKYQSKSNRTDRKNKQYSLSSPKKKSSRRHRNEV